MQGIWKTKISGYKKDNKRKSITKKQFLNDKKTFIEKEILKQEEKNIKSNFVKEEKKVFSYKNLVLNRKDYKLVSKEWMLGGEYVNTYINRKTIKDKVKKGEYEIIDKSGYLEYY